MNQRPVVDNLASQIEEAIKAEFYRYVSDNLIEAIETYKEKALIEVRKEADRLFVAIMQDHIGDVQIKISFRK